MRRSWSLVHLTSFPWVLPGSHQHRASTRDISVTSGWTARTQVARVRAFREWRAGIRWHASISLVSKFQFVVSNDFFRREFLRARTTWFIRRSYPDPWIADQGYQRESSPMKVELCDLAKRSCRSGPGMTFGNYVHRYFTSGRKPGKRFSLDLLWLT